MDGLLVRRIKGLNPSPLGATIWTVKFTADNSISIIVFRLISHLKTICFLMTGIKSVLVRSWSERLNVNGSKYVYRSRHYGTLFMNVHECAWICSNRCLTTHVYHR